MDTGAALLFDRDNPYQPIPRRRARLTPIKACIALKPLPRRATDAGAEVGRPGPLDGGGGGEVSHDSPDILRVVRRRALGGKPLEHCLDLFRVPTARKIVAGNLGGDLMPLTLGDTEEPFPPILELPRFLPLPRGLWTSESEQPLRCEGDLDTVWVMPAPPRIASAARVETRVGDDIATVALEVQALEVSKPLHIADGLWPARVAEIDVVPVPARPRSWRSGQTIMLILEAAETLIASMPWINIHNDDP